MITRFFHLILGFNLALAGWTTLAAEPTLGGPRPPNLVLFLADDAGWGDYGVNGNPDVRTPHIDSLARDGVSLNWFFVQPVCAPTRAEFLTGRYHPRSGVRGVSTGQERMDLGERTLAEDFKAAGYATGAFGKWHNGSQWPYHPQARGFDEYYGYTSGHWGEYVDPPLERNGRMERAQGYIVDVCTDAALEFIGRHRDRPFLCYVPFTTPHSPWSVPDDYWRRFRDRPITRRAAGTGQEDVDQTRCALAMMENQDDNVGRVLRQLEGLGLSENTIVVYFSDNGPNTWRWNGGMKGRKGGTDDGSVRSPCFIRWPAGLPAGRVVPRIAGAIDLLPTLTALASVKRLGDRPLDGRDLSPLLRGETVEWPDRLLFTHWAGRISVRSDRHRLDAAGQLYDLVADPGQTRNVTDAQPETARQLQQAVTAWRAEVFGEGWQAIPGGAVDPRPVPVGHPEFPITLLPARDGEPRGGVRRSASAPNSSYFTNWTTPEDRMVWNLEVHTTGEYDVVIDYTCPLDDAGSRVLVEFGNARLAGQVAPGWDPPLYTHQDTLPRPPAESRMKEFRSLPLGRVLLEAGRGELVLRALEIPGRTVADVRRVTLTLRDSPVKDPERVSHRPNVLFIAVDDLRNDLGVLGAAHARTPALDAFASTARAFSRHYAQVPTCGASRCSLLRGRYPSVPAQLGNAAIQETHGQWAADSLPAVFRRNGYQTLALGKIGHHPGGRTGKGWAEGPEELPGAWDRCWVPTGPWGTPEALMHGYAHGVARQPGRSPPWEAADVPDDAYPDAWVADEAIASLRRLKAQAVPWFLAVGFFKPHLPFAAPRRWHEMHTTGVPDLTPAAAAKPDWPSGWHASGEFRKNYGLPFDRDPDADPETARTLRRAYAASISYVDAQIGRVLDEWRRLGLDRDTVVVVWSDHGFLLGEHAIWGKHCLYEQALRAPLILRTPGMALPGRVSRAVVETVDVFPTLADLCGLPVPEGLDGRSLRRQIDDPDAPTSKAALGFWSGDRRTVRTDRWRLILQGGAEAVELFDAEADPDETRNVADRHPEVVRDLSRMARSVR